MNDEVDSGMIRFDDISVCLKMSLKMIKNQSCGRFALSETHCERVS